MFVEKMKNQPPKIEENPTTIEDFDLNYYRSRLIDLVQSNPNLWNKNYPRILGKNRLNKNDRWEKIAEELGVTSAKARRTWDNLRDQYRRDLKRHLKNGAKPKWIFFDRMNFIRKELRIPADQNNLSETESENEFNQSAAETKFPPAERTIHMQTKVKPNGKNAPAQITVTYPRNMMPIRNATTTRKQQQFEEITSFDDEDTISSFGSEYNEVSSSLSNNETSFDISKLAANETFSPSTSKLAKRRRSLVRTTSSPAAENTLTADLKLPLLKRKLCSNKEMPPVSSVEQLEVPIQNNEDSICSFSSIPTDLQLIKIELPSELSEAFEAHTPSEACDVTTSARVNRPSVSDPVEPPNIAITSQLNDDYHFVMSILPALQQIDPSHKFSLRLKFMNLIAEHLAKE